MSFQKRREENKTRFLFCIPRAFEILNYFRNNYGFNKFVSELLGQQTVNRSYDIHPFKNFIADSNNNTCRIKFNILIFTSLNLG